MKGQFLELPGSLKSIAKMMMMVVVVTMTMMKITAAATVAPETMRCRSCNCFIHPFYRATHKQYIHSAVHDVETCASVYTSVRIPPPSKQR